jgi:hypothetical protein
VGLGGVDGARVIRVVRNPSERGVRHGAGVGRGEQCAAWGRMEADGVGGA